MPAPTVRGTKALKKSATPTTTQAPHPRELEKESPVPSWLSKAGAGAERSPHTVCPQQPATAETFKWLQLQPG